MPKLPIPDLRHWAQAHAGLDWAPHRPEADA